MSATVPHPAHARPEQTVKPAYARNMVNPGMVNVPAAWVPEADFREIFRVFAPIPRSQNPVKYKSRSKVNGETVHFVPGGHSGKHNLSRNIKHIEAA